MIPGAPGCGMGWDAQFFVQKPRATRAFSKAKGKAQVRNKILLKQVSPFAIRDSIRFRYKAVSSGADGLNSLEAPESCSDVRM